MAVRAYTRAAAAVALELTVTHPATGARPVVAGDRTPLVAVARLGVVTARAARSVPVTGAGADALIIRMITPLQEGTGEPRLARAGRAVAQMVEPLRRVDPVLAGSVGYGRSEIITGW